MSQDKCLNCGFELPDSPREKRYMAGLGSLSNPETEAITAANCRIAELEAGIMKQHEEIQRLRDALRIYADPDTWGNDGWGVKAVNTWEYKDAGAAARQALLGSGEK